MTDTRLTGDASDQINVGDDIWAGYRFHHTLGDIEKPSDREGNQGTHRKNI
jgi:hypothetical protein